MRVLPGKSIYILYTEDSIMEGRDEEYLSNIVSSIKVESLYITEEGDI